MSSGFVQGLRRAALVGAVVVAAAVVAPRSTEAAVLAGGELEIGWTGGAPFGDYVNTGLGEAVGTFDVPMGGYFTTASYASSTDMRTSVSDTTITITNASAFATFAPTQWFVYRDLTDSLPDFRTLAIAIDASNTTAAFNLATDLRVQENAIALQFSGVAPTQTVTLSVPEPASLALVGGAGAAALLTRRRRA